MKTTLSVNIGGVNFIIDDDAYDRLKTYLDAIRSKYSAQAGGDEIVADIEARIAELFKQEIKFPQQVVGIRLVKQTIATLGDEDDLGASETSDSNSNYEPKRDIMAYKRFYRNPDGMVLGGVCTGLGAYFNIDPVIVRIAFIALLFAGVSILLYPLIWIVTPMASTPTQRLEMKGEPVTPENIEREYQNMNNGRR